MRLLARREHGFAELVSKLETRGVTRDIALAVIQQLTDEGLQSDARYVEGWIRSRMSRGKGPRLIRAELRQRQIDDSLVAAGFDAVAPDWSALATEVRMRKFGQDPPEEFDERARQSRFLESRGFSAEQIRHALQTGE